MRCSPGPDLLYWAARSRTSPGSGAGTWPRSRYDGTLSDSVAALHRGRRLSAAVPRSAALQRRRERDGPLARLLSGPQPDLRRGFLLLRQRPAAELPLARRARPTGRSTGGPCRSATSSATRQDHKPGPNNAWTMVVTDTRASTSGSDASRTTCSRSISTTEPRGHACGRTSMVGNVESVALSPDGTRLFAGGHFGTAQARLPAEPVRRRVGARHDQREPCRRHTSYCDWIPDDPAVRRHRTRPGRAWHRRTTPAPGT